jgi:Uncharacterized conserved protein
MHTKNWWATALAFGAAFFLALPVSAQERRDEVKGAKVEVPHSMRSSHLIGMRVKNKENKDVGAIDDLVVGLNSGEIRYAALSFGGFAGFGNKLFAVPWEALTLKFGEKDNHFVFDVTEEQLKDAPGFDKNNWPNVADAAWVASIDKHYKVDRKARHEAQANAEGRKAGGNIVYDDGYRVSTIKGMKVRNEEQKDLGRVDELVFNVKEGDIGYVALSFGSVAGFGGKLFAIPFQAFKLHATPSEKYFVLNVSEEKLKAAPGFDANHWPNTADPNWSRDIDRYYGDLRTAERTAPRKD